MEKLKEFFNSLNKYGIPLPLLKDSKTGMGSISLTMLWISFNVVLVGLIGKWSKYLDIDLTNALTFFGICSGLYFSRKVTSKNEKKEESKNE